MNWPESVTVIDADSLESHPHLYSTHHQSLPGLWAMFRKVFPDPLEHQQAIQALPIAVYLLNTAPTTFSSRNRRVVLYNLVCSMLGYTEGQSSQILLLTEKAHAIRTNYCSPRGTSTQTTGRDNQVYTEDQQAHEKYNPHSHDGEVLLGQSQGTRKRPIPRRSHT